MNCHLDAIRIERPADEVFAFMADPSNMDRWSFGTWQIDVSSDGLINGRSMLDGTTICVRIEADRDSGLIDYHLGTDPAQLVPRIFARVVPATHAGGPGSHSILMLIAHRSDDMNDARWQRLVASHGAELQLVKAALETGFDHRLLRR